VDGETATVDVGVPYVEFGSSYFPYSTMTENFDFYRTATLTARLVALLTLDVGEMARVPAPDGDRLRICKAMGFDWVRLHHLELIGKMNRENALAFLDFYMGTSKALGMKYWLTRVARLSG